MPRYTAPDGCRIHYETFGSAGPRVALVPGLGGDGRFWAGVVAALERDHCLIVPDHRGAGRSDRPDGAYTIPGITADVVGILAESGGPAHVVGHSTGGAVAQEMALDHPASGLSYTISSSWARSDARFRALFTARAELLDAGLAAPYQRLTHVFGFDAAYLAAQEAALDAAVEAAAEKLRPLSVTAARVRMLLGHDRLDDLPRIAAPVLVIAAEDDVLTPPALSEPVAAAIPGAHFHPAADPERFAALIRGFVARTEG